MRLSYFILAALPQPRQVAATAHGQPVRDPGQRHGRPGAHGLRQAHFLRIPFAVRGHKGVS